MPKFIFKHCCCYIAPVDSESSMTCKVFENLEFDRVSPSDAFCRGGKSSPDFCTPQYPKTISWADQSTARGETSMSLETEIDSIELKSLKPDISETVHKRKIQIDEIFHDHNSFITLYGRDFNDAFYDSDKEFTPVTEDSSIYRPTTKNIPANEISNSSIYRPTTKNIPANEISNSDKFLDCLTVCLWKCSSWCQKVN